ncbi:hypothetical protein [Prosthecobacter sp.]|uniref:hypothetical protein n=1 Tax=Prosthecobacter sp. TaxID=1965333 RepID=UPI0037832D0B
MSTTTLLSSGKAGLLLATAMFTLSSCDPYMGYGYGGGYGNGGYGGYGYPASLSTFIPVGNSYNYSYYPRYGAYYHRPTQQYHYLSGNNWMSGPRLPGYSHSTIQASHSVPFNFNSHPSNFHSQVSHSFPQNWSPPSGAGSSGGHQWNGGGSSNSSHHGGWSGSGSWNGHHSFR